MRRRWRGIYSLHTKSNRYTVFQSRWDRINKLGLTEVVNLVTVRSFGGTDMQLGRTDMVRVRAQRNLGETDYTNSVRPITKLGWTDFGNKLTREFAL